jgi:flagellar protein FliJ
MHGNRPLTTGRRDRELRLKRREQQEAALQFRSLEATVRDFECAALDLEQQIAAEEARTRITDPAHFAYSTFATAARIRQSNLSITIADLTARLTSARREHDAMKTELEELAPPEGREPSAPQPGADAFSEGGLARAAMGIHQDRSKRRVHEDR